MGLTCDGLGQERLARSRRANEQRTLRDLAAQLGVFLGVLEELHDLLDLLFGLHQSGHIFEGHLYVRVLIEELRTRLAYAEDPTGTAGTAARHASHEEEPEQDDDDEGPHGSEDVPKDVVALLVGHLGGDMLLGHHLVVEVGELVG